MNSEQLKQFKAVADYGNMTKAAEAIFISQPSLSYAIKKIEEELGCKLFDRKGNQIILNENGRKLLEYSIRCEILFNELHENFTGKPREENTITIKSSTSLSEFISEYYNADPSLNFNISNIRNDESLEDLLNKNDALILDDSSVSRIRQKNLKTQFLFTNELLICVLKDHELAKKDIAQLKEIEQYSLAVVKGKDGKGRLFRWISSIERTESLHFNYAHEISQAYWKSLTNTPYPFFCSSTVCMYDEPIMKHRACIPINSDLTRKDFYICYLRENEEFLKGFLKASLQIAKIYQERRKGLYKI